MNTQDDFLTALATTEMVAFLAKAYKVPPEAHMALLELCDTVEDRNRAAFLSIFASFLVANGYIAIGDIKNKERMMPIVGEKLQEFLADAAIKNLTAIGR